MKQYRASSGGIFSLILHIKTLKGLQDLQPCAKLTLLAAAAKKC